MDSRVMQSKTYFAVKRNIALGEVALFAAEIIPQLQNALSSSNLIPTGPIEFIYHGLTGNPADKFDLLIGIPIKEKGQAVESFCYFESNLFKCVCCDYQGSIFGIKQAWSSFIEEALQAGVTPTDECREIYKKWVDFDSLENITELQIGIS